MKQLLIGLVVLGVLGVGSIFVYTKKTNAPQMTTNTPEHTVVLTETGYQPDSLTIKVGETLTFSTIRNEPHWPASDNHPIHEDYPEFDPHRGLAADESWSFTFSKPGEWHFHDHLYSPFTGTVTVVE